MGGTNDFETLGFLDIRELDAKGFSTAAGATPLGSDAMLSVSGSIGSFDRPAVATELGGTSVTRVDGAAYRPIDFTAGAGTGFATTVAFEEISAGTTKPDFSVIVVPVEKQVEVVVPSAPVNQAPVFESGSATGAEDSTISGMVVATDADGDSLTVTKLTDPTHGTVTVHANGSFDYVPAANWNGTDSFDVAVSDGKGGIVTGTVTVTATPVNDLPTASDISVSTNEDTSTGGTLTASDVDGDSLTFSLASGPSHGTASVNASGAWSYTPDAGFSGSDQFTVSVSDGNGGSASIVVGVTVAAVNDLPVASDASAMVAEDGSVSGTLSATDVDGDVLTWSLASAASHGTATVAADGGWTYTPDSEFNGSDSFDATVSDGNGGTRTVTVDVTVTPVNDTPVAGGAVTASGDEDTVLTGTVTGSDVDGDTVSFAVKTQGAKGSVAVDGSGNWTYTPTANATGADSFTVRVSDGNGGFADHMVAVTIDPVNDVPTASDVAVTISEDGTASGTLTATDVDGDGLSWSPSASPTHGNVTVTADGGWSYEPDADFAGSDQFTATVSDGHGGTATVTVDLTVTPVNDAPVVADVALGSTDEDAAFDFTAADLLAGASDVDLDALSVASVTLTSGNGAVTDLGGGNYRFVPAAGWNGQVVLSFGISDGTTVTTAQATLTVAAVNDAPTAADQGFSVNEDAALNGTLTASDVDGDSLTFAKATDPAHGSVTVNANGTFTYTPDANWNGTDSFDFSVSDGNGGIVTKTATVTVDPIADAPNAALADASGTEDTAIALDFTGTGLNDPSETLTVQISGLPADATLSAGTDLGGGVWRLTAAQLAGLTVTAPTPGTYSLTMTAISTESDGSTATRTDTASLTVAAGNAAPTASDANMLVLQNNPVAFKLRASDPDGNPLTESLHTAPSHGTVAWDAGIGEWLYTPDMDYSGADSFVMQVDDGNGGTATSTYSVQIRSESAGLAVNAESDVVNYDSGSTNRPAIAADSDGSYAVFAADYNVAGNLVFFGADGTPTGVNIDVKPGTGTFGGDTDIAYFADGSHRVIIVKGDESGTTDGDDWGFSISIYGEDGTAVATNVVPYDPAIFANRQYDIGLAALEGANAGEAIVTFQCRYKAGWTYDTWGVVVNSDGTYGTPFQINQATSYAYESDVAALANGGFVAAWEAADANDRGVYMRFFDSAFAATSGDVAVNTTTAGYQGRPEIAASSSGVAVTRVSADNMLRMRTFDTAGNATSAEIVVGPQNRYRWWDVAAHGDEFCVVWEAADSDGTGVWMQRFSIADGSSLGAASLVASTETGTQARPDVDYTGDGSLVFVYDDGSVTKIRTRSHTAADNTIAFVGTDGGDAVYGSSGADDFHGGLGNDVFFSGGGADVIRFSSILEGEDTLDSVDFTQGASIVLSGILTAGQLDLAHMRFEAVYGSDDTIAFEVDHDGDGGWDRLALLTNAKEATGAMDGDGNFDAVSQAQLDTALQGLIDGGQITA